LSLRERSQEALIKIGTPFTKDCSHLLEPQMTAQTPAKILNTADLQKFPFVPINDLPQILQAANRSLRIITFDFKLKPESVPQWDGNPDVLARWISKINHLANNSSDIHAELGKIIP